MSSQFYYLYGIQFYFNVLHNVFNTSLTVTFELIGLQLSASPIPADTLQEQDIFPVWYTPKHIVRTLHSLTRFLTRILNQSCLAKIGLTSDNLHSLGPSPCCFTCIQFLVGSLALPNPSNSQLSDLSDPCP